MSQEITLSMDGLLLNWLKNVGDSVNSGDVIAEVEADKATVEVEAPTSGVLLEQRAQTGDELTEGAIIGTIGEAGEGPTNQPAPEEKQAPPAETAKPAESAPEPAAQAASNGGQQQASVTEDGRIKASPLARNIAEEKGIDLSQVKGSGPGGRIVKADVESFTPGAAPAQPAAAAAAPAAAGPAAGQYHISPAIRPLPAASAEVEHIDINTMRKRIAAGTMESKQFIPHFYVTSEVDVEALLAVRKQLNNSLPEGGTKISVNDMVVKATALTLRQFPNLNSHYYGDKLVRYNNINVGVAVAMPQGGVIYVVDRDADKVSLGTLATLNKEMAGRAREGKIKPTDISGATFSTSNLGGFDVEHFAAIINPPESGVLAIGTAQKVPVVKDDDTLGIGYRMKVTISVDHRVSDGAEGAQFLQTFKELIENPMRLLM
ncbi:MAG: 2-oxo acid dehydrogenase subunit E2 [Anaerolineae bacterium]|nr:2-oxo acid dehydrogenase subunit E2 [Anaerolineae bacterium]